MWRLRINILHILYETLKHTDKPLTTNVFERHQVAQMLGIGRFRKLNEHTKLFDFCGDGKSDLWVGAFAWMVSNEMKIKTRDYGLNYNALNLEQFVFLTILKEKMCRPFPEIQPPVEP